MKTRILIMGFVIGLLVLFGVNSVYGLWIPRSAQELLEQSQTIFVGNITGINAVQVEKSTTYGTEENGIPKTIVENYTLTLEDYDVRIAEFLKNPQDFSIITVREPTVSAAGYESTIGGFQIGDRVLFYVESLNGTNTYLPESFKIPTFCKGQDVLTQTRLEFGGEFFTIQNGIKVDYGNFTADKPVLFVYNKDVRTLSGQSFDVIVEISKNDGKHAKAVFSKEIHAASKPCEWIAHAEWEFTPKEGDYNMDINIKENGTITDQSHTGFSIKSDLVTYDPISPLKQFKSGIKVNEIQCTADLQLVVKSSNGSPACVTPETKQKLIERGWAKYNSHNAIYDKSDFDRIQIENSGMENQTCFGIYSNETRVSVACDMVTHGSPPIPSKPETKIQCQGNKMCLTEVVTRIVDGDTIHITGGHKIRLSLTNTPEMYESGFYKATQFTENLCPVGSKVIVDQDDMQPYDAYDRLLGKVICDGKILNAELLHNGHANILTQYCKTSEFSKEKWAQEFGCQ